MVKLASRVGPLRGEVTGRSIGHGETPLEGIRVVLTGSQKAAIKLGVKVHT